MRALDAACNAQRSAMAQWHPTTELGVVYVACRAATPANGIRAAQRPLDRQAVTVNGYIGCRMRYPDALDGMVAASAPILSFDGLSPPCANRPERAKKASNVYACCWLT